MFTPTSRYWNCVLTGLTLPAATMPVWNEPVAIGTRSPILSVAFSSFRARIWGFCRSLVLLSLARNENEPPGTLECEIAHRECRRRRFRWPRRMLGLTPMLMDVGTFVPMRAKPVAVYLHHGDIDNHLGLGFVDGG